MMSYEICPCQNCQTLNQYPSIHQDLHNLHMRPVRNRAPQTQTSIVWGRVLHQMEKLGKSLDLWTNLSEIYSFIHSFHFISCHFISIHSFIHSFVTLLGFERCPAAPMSKDRNWAQGSVMVIAEIKLGFDTDILCTYSWTEFHHTTSHLIINLYQSISYYVPIQIGL
mgnify:CR=1 FL=1